MREGAHPGRIAAYPAEDVSQEATRTLWRPIHDTVGTGPTDEPAD